MIVEIAEIVGIVVIVGIPGIVEVEVVVDFWVVDIVIDEIGIVENIEIESDYYFGFVEIEILLN